ncbi:MAG: transposase [Syntrophothermus sp.]
MARKGQQFRQYTPEEKLSAVKKVLIEGYSFHDASREMGIFKHSIVSRWVKEFNNYGSQYFSQNNRLKKSGRRKKKFNSPQEEIEYWKAENAILKEMLESKKKRNMK